MSVRTKLILIFLCLSVVPLAALTVISYSNSVSSLRELVEEDNRAAAEDLQQRVSRLDDEIYRSVAAVTELPELRGIDLGRPLSGDETEQVAHAMQREVSDRWGLFSDLEFHPARELLPPAPEAPAPVRREARAAARPAPAADPHRQAAHAGSAMPSTVVEVDSDAESDADWSMKIFLPDFSKLDDSGEGTPTVREYQLSFVDGEPTAETVEALTGGVMENLTQLPGFLLQTGDSGRSIRLRNFGQDVRREMMEQMEQIDVELEVDRGKMQDAAEGQELTALERRAEILRRFDDREPVRGQAIELPVSHQDGVVGTVIAHIRPDRVLAQVFDGVAAGENEIPFAVDPDGQLYTRRPEDLRKLTDLGLADPQVDDPEQVSARAVSREPEVLTETIQKPDWITVIQENPETGYTFGVARHVSRELQSIRTSTLLNLFIGFTLIGLAGSGIIVFSGRMTSGLGALTEGARRIAEGDLSHRIDTRRKDELGQLAGAFNEMASDLSATRKRLLEQERVRRELEIARGIQRDSLPREPFSGGDVEILGRSIPSNEVGGDFYNFVTLEDGRVAFLIGDVSGKGVPAALLMAEVQATLRTLLQYERDGARILAQVNEEVERTKPPQVYLTLFLGILDQEAGTLTYVNAGHNPPFIMRPTEGSIIELKSSCRPVGLYRDSPMVSVEVAIEPGDLICLYTDGVVESQAFDSDEFFGRKRVEDAIRESEGDSLASLMEEIARRLTGFHGGDALEDDATMMLARVAWIQRPLDRLPGDRPAVNRDGLPS